MAELFLKEGDVLQNRYKIEALLSGSGKGQVYKASDIRFPGKAWAIKAFQHAPADVFNRDAKTLAMMSHPHMVKVVDYFQEKQNLCLVMELVGGKSLDKILEAAGIPLPERQVLSWGIQCADALLYLHGQIKRDFSCRNFSPRKILITNSSELKLIPEMPELADALETQGVMGFAPPEMFEEDEECDDRSDVYALAAVLHRCLAGDSPANIPFVFVPIRSVNSRIVSPIERVLEKATQTNPGKRYPGLQEFRNELYSCFKEVMRVHPRSKSMRDADRSLGLWWLLMALSGASIVLWLYMFL